MDNLQVSATTQIKRKEGRQTLCITGMQMNEHIQSPKVPG